MKIYLRRLLFIFSLFIMLIGGVVNAGSDSTRAIFDEAIYWARPEADIRNRLHDLKRAGFNTYIACVWHGQGAIWNSKVAPLWYKNAELAKSDPLKKFIEIAHEEGFKVYPCFTVMLRQHEFLESYTSSSGKKNVFNVHNPNFREFMVELILEVIKNYDIDGINLDYIRTGQVCHDKFCRDNYNYVTNRNLMIDIAKHKVDKVAYNSIVMWQRQAIYMLLNSIVSKARVAKEDLNINVSAAPWADSVVIEGQNSIEWANNGLIDDVFSMNYQARLNWESLRDVQSKFDDPGKFIVMFANYHKDNDTGKLLSREGIALRDITIAASNFNPKGSYATYIYSMMTNEQFDSLSFIGKDNQGGL